MFICNSISVSFVIYRDFWTAFLIHLGSFRHWQDYRHHIMSINWRTSHYRWSVASKDISEDFKRSSFVTSLYGVLDANTGEFTFARAGHEHPIILGPAPGQHNIVESQGSPLGLDRVCDLSVALEERTIEIAEGSFLVLTTDGLPEARNEKKTQYTRERLFFDLAKVSKDMSCKQVLRIIRDSLQSFTNGASQEDDITLILIKRDSEH